MSEPLPDPGACLTHRQMRTPLAFAALLGLAACGDPGRATQEALDASAEADDRIPCAVEGESDFEDVCTIERAAGEEGLILTVRHPGGGFRRLLVTQDGRGVVAADGADPAVVAVIDDNRIEVTIAGDQYRLPATIKADTRQGS